MTRFRWIGIAAGAAMAACATQASAQDDRQLCFHSNDASARTVSACTRMLQRRDLQAAERGFALNNRGFFHQQLEQYDRAIADFDAAIEADPNGTAVDKVYNNRGNSLRFKGEHAKAVADFDKALALAPAQPPSRKAIVLNNRAATLREMGDLDRALKGFDEAIALEKLAPFYSARGLAWRAKGDLGRAREDFSEAIRLNPKLVSSHVGRGLVYEAQGDREKAVADFRTAIALPPFAAITANGVDASGKRFQGIARARLAVLTDGMPPSQRATAPDQTPQPASPSPAPTPVAASGRQIALVIGNGAYSHAGALANPANDARSVAKAMRDIGFQVTEAIDLNRTGMDRTIRDFLMKASGARTAVLFYAGHGMQIDGRNYLVPVDTRFISRELLGTALLDLDTILAGLDDQIRTNIVILDACRDNPLAKTASAGAAGRSVAAAGGLAAPTGVGKGAAAGAGTLIAFATAPGQIALDGEGANSPFSTALVRHMPTPGLEVQQMLTRVRADVVSSTRSKQVPWSNSSLLGEVYLAGKQ
jgi:tetratricopeptide (TPR) repeat protein